MRGRMETIGGRGIFHWINRHTACRLCMSIYGLCRWKGVAFGAGCGLGVMGIGKLRTERARKTKQVAKQAHTLTVDYVAVLLKISILYFVTLADQLPRL